MPCWASFSWLFTSGSGRGTRATYEDKGDHPTFSNRATKPDGKINENHATFVSVFGDPGDKMYTKFVFEKIYDSRSAPMHVSIQLFPWAVVSYISAVAVKVIAAASGETSSYYAHAATVTIMAVFALPMVYYGRKILMLVVA